MEVPSPKKEVEEKIVKTNERNDGGEKQGKRPSVTERENDKLKNRDGVKTATTDRKMVEKIEKSLSTDGTKTNKKQSVRYSRARIYPFSAFPRKVKIVSERQILG